ncbi:cupin domain-containing protein [Halogeometricum sp. S1BR25-6]|uniref:Cupin domain-containing protein n=1 Tax=Halogeometricum salsisoli TaxID=2950536 RepID=A0ABU2GGZ2_9EURY|nr:cupin domain-containing protein [Halogeometricum sp. S1BR25-6]MDS0299518.1 cupin domain-containing protein [Halogeometricum sp. S1BR25-6]
MTDSTDSAVRPVTLADAFDSFEETWSPRLAAELNGQTVKLAKMEDAFVWHSHPDADELFLVVDGSVTLELREQANVTLGAGELAVVPRGVEHRPVSEAGANVLLFEPSGTENTGDAEDGAMTADVRDL